MENGVGNNLLRAAIDDGRQVGLLPVKFELGHVGIPFVLGVNRPKIVLDQVGLLDLGCRSSCYTCTSVY